MSISNEVAISVEQVNKDFMVPHEKVDSLKGHMIRLFKRTKKEKYPILKGINFNVKSGEFFGVVGRNGSGKSTLLKILAGVYRPTVGNITINGSMATFIELGVGFNFDLSGRDNIFLNGTILGMSKKEIVDRFDNILSFSGLEEFIDQKVKNYSSGMQVRLAFAIAIQADADIYLVDEVLAVGDSNFQKKCYAEFRKLKSAGKTIIFVSHDMDSIQEFCDRVLMLKNGKVELIGTPRQVAMSYEIENIGLSSKRQSKIKKIHDSIGIESIEIMSREKNGKLVFELPDSISIEIRIKAKEARSVIVAISFISTEGGKYMAGYNTKNRLGEVYMKVGMNRIECNVPARQFAKGSYSVNAAIFNFEDFKLIDYLDSSQGMTTPIVSIIERDESKDGEFNLEGEWKLL